MNSVEELAILGGRPSFSDALHVGYPSLGDEQVFKKRVDGILKSHILTNDGPLVRDFEERIAELTGADYCVATCNGTLGLELAIRAAGLCGEVIVPSFTFIATVHALMNQGIKPVFCDIHPRTHNIDASQIESLITPRTTGILGVHLWGRPCEVERLTEIAERYHLKLIFDAAHAIGCSYQDRMVGSLGHAEVFSFHATKIVHSFEGGAITTNDRAMADQLKRMRNFGFVGYDQVSCLGTNGKLTEVCAAMGLTSLEGLDESIRIYRQRHRAYSQKLHGIAGLGVLQYGELGKSTYQYVVLEVEGAALSRNELLEVLWKENVLARRYFWPGCHAMEPYRSLQPDAADRLPHTTRLGNSVLVLPTGPEVSLEAVHRICQIIKNALGDASRIRRALGQMAHYPKDVATADAIEKW